MSRSRKLAAAGGVVLVLAAAVLLALRGVSASLESVIRARIADEAAARYGAETDIGQVRVRLFPGRVLLRQVSIRQPGQRQDAGGLSAESVCARGSVANLLGAGDRRIRRLEIDGLRLSIERSKASGTFVPALTRVSPEVAEIPRVDHQPSVPPATAPAAASSRTPARPGAAPSPRPVASPVASGSAPPSQLDARVLVDRADVRGEVRFVDTSFDGQPFTIDFGFSVRGENLRWQEGRPLDGGRVALSGHLAGDPALWAFSVAADARPSKGDGWSFDAGGTVSNARPSLVAPYLESAGVTCSNLDMALHLECRGGILRAEPSRLRLAMSHVALTGRSARKSGLSGTLLDELTLDIPVSGSLSEPEFNVAYALLSALAGQGGAGSSSPLADQLLKNAGRAAASALGKWLDRHAGEAADTNAPAASGQPGAPE